MIAIFQLLCLTIFIVGSAKTEILSASDVDICRELCSGCNGTSIFRNGVCDCRPQDDNDKSIECLKNAMKRQKDNLNLESITAIEDTANRDARCSLLKARKRMRTGDVDRVIHYFANDGPRTGMPFLGDSNVDCASGQSRNAANNCQEASGPEIAEPIMGKTASRQKNNEDIALVENYVPIVSSMKLTKHQQRLLGTTSRGLESRALIPPRHDLLGAVSSKLLRIPQVLANIVTPEYSAPRYSSFLGMPQFFEPLSSVHPSGLFSIIGNGIHEVPRSMNDAISAYVPENNYDSMIGASQGRMINPYVGIPNALLAGVQTPSYYPGLLGAMHYGSMLGAAPRSNVDEIKKIEENVAQSEPLQSQKSSQTDEEKSNLLYGAIAQQNSILESLDQQLRNYSPYVGMPYYQYSPMPYNMVGAPAPTGQWCRNDQHSSMLGARRHFNHQPAAKQPGNPSENHSSNPMSSGVSKNTSAASK